MSYENYNRLQNSYENKINDLEENRKRIRLYSLGGTIITSIALAAELLVGSLSKPLDVGYYFNSDNVSIDQPVSDDYTTKSYTVQDNQDLFTTFTFSDLENIEPNVHDGYTSVPEEYLHEGSGIEIQRVEDNPIKVKCNKAALVTLFAGGAFVIGLDYAKKKIEEEEEMIMGRMRR